MDILASRNFSLACAIFNGVMTVGAVTNGSWGWAAICAIFCGVCATNYFKAR